MSASVFPALPGVDVKKKRSVSYETTVLRAWSGKEVRQARQTTGRASISLVVNFARDNVNCLVSPWTGYSELGVIKYFFDTAKGQLDTFHIADPDGGSDLVVRFATDTLDLEQVVPHVWRGTIELVAVF